MGKVNGRTVGIVNVNAKCLNSELIRKGYAWVFDKHCKKDMCVMNGGCWEKKQDNQIWSLVTGWTCRTLDV